MAARAPLFPQLAAALPPPVVAAPPVDPFELSQTARAGPTAAGPDARSAVADAPRTKAQQRLLEKKRREEEQRRAAELRAAQPLLALDTPPRSPVDAPPPSRPLICIDEPSPPAPLSRPLICIDEPSPPAPPASAALLLLADLQPAFDQPVVAAPKPRSAEEQRLFDLEQEIARLRQLQTDQLRQQQQHNILQLLETSNLSSSSHQLSISQPPPSSSSSASSSSSLFSSSQTELIVEDKRRRKRRGAGRQVGIAKHLPVEFVCRSCAKPFVEPRALSCMHSFCSHCLHFQLKNQKHLHGDNVIVCEICGELTAVPEKDVQFLPKDLDLLHRVAAYKAANGSARFQPGDVVGHGWNSPDLRWKEKIDDDDDARPQAAAGPATQAATASKPTDSTLAPLPAIPRRWGDRRREAEKLQALQQQQQTPSDAVEPSSRAEPSSADSREVNSDDNDSDDYDDDYDDDDDDDDEQSSIEPTDDSKASSEGAPVGCDQSAPSAEETGKTFVSQAIEGGPVGRRAPAVMLETFSRESIKKLTSTLDTEESAYAAFALSIDRAAGKLRKWIKSRWFAPATFRDFNPSTILQHYFLPFWQFRVKTSTHYSCEAQAKGSDVWTTDAGTLTGLYTDILISAAHDVELYRWQREFSLDVDWQPKRAVRPLARVQDSEVSIDALSIPLQWTTIWQQQSVEIKNLEEAKAIAQMKRDGRKIKNPKIVTTFSDFVRRLVYLPIYIGHYTFENKQYSVAVHGQSGNVIGERPLGFSLPEFGAS